MVTIHIVDDHAISRWGLQRALEMQDHIRVTGLFGAIADLIRGWHRRLVPDLVVLDLYLAAAHQAQDPSAEGGRIIPMRK